MKLLLLFAIPLVSSACLWDAADRHWLCDWKEEAAEPMPGIGVRSCSPPTPAATRSSTGATYCAGKPGQTVELANDGKKLKVIETDRLPVVGTGSVPNTGPSNVPEEMTCEVVSDMQDMDCSTSAEVCAIGKRRLHLRCTQETSPQQARR